jgi:hypothetical protein
MRHASISQNTSRHIPDSVEYDPAGHGSQVSVRMVFDEIFLGGWGIHMSMWTNQTASQIKLLLKHHDTIIEHELSKTGFSPKE